MGKKSRRKPAKEARSASVDDDDDWSRPTDAEEQQWIAEAFAGLDVDEPGTAPAHPLAARDREFGLNPFTAAPRREKERLPSCDVCGVDGARYRCDRCESQAYCSQACQAHAWREGGHRAACATVRAVSEAEAAAVVAQLGDASLPPPARVRDLERLDGHAVYGPAVAYGLLAALRGVLRAECDFAALRAAYADPPLMLCSMLQHVACVVFRGQRRSRAGAGGFSKVDGARFAAFVDSADDAWELWLMATATLARVATDRRVSAEPEAHAVCHRFARDALCSLCMALARPEVAAALFEPRGGGDDAEPDLPRARARRSAGLFKRLLDHLAATSIHDDPNATLKANANQACAEFAYWCAASAVGVDVDRVVGLRGARKRMYDLMAVPLARATIAKRRLLNTAEAREAMTAIVPNFDRR